MVNTTFVGTPRHVRGPFTTTTVINQRITSSGRLPNAKRPESDLLDRQQWSRAEFEKYRDEQVDEDILVNEDTKAHRKWFMGIWNG